MTLRPLIILSLAALALFSVAGTLWQYMIIVTLLQAQCMCKINDVCVCVWLGLGSEWSLHTYITYKKFCSIFLVRSRYIVSGEWPSRKSIYTTPSSTIVVYFTVDIIVVSLTWMGGVRFIHHSSVFVGTQWSFVLMPLYVHTTLHVHMSLLHVHMSLLHVYECMPLQQNNLSTFLLTDAASVRAKRQSSAVSTQCTCTCAYQINVSVSHFTAPSLPSDARPRWSPRKWCSSPTWITRTTRPTWLSRKEPQ